MRFVELTEHQALPLKDKIGRAVTWIGKAFDASKHTQSIAFSGGKDSTVLADLILRYFPNKKPYCIFGNTGVEYPDSLKFAREYGREHFGERFIEARPEKLTRDGLKYQAQREVLQWLEETGQIKKFLKKDGKLRRTEELEDAATPEMWADFRARNLVWRAGMTKSYWWCIDQYGFPILGKAACKLDARRINIDCFLKYSQSTSADKKLLDYYDLIKGVKISQHCCQVLKKEPSHRVQTELGVDCVFMGVMASESRRRMLSYCTNGELYQTAKVDVMADGSPVWHCHPMGIWTDADVWEYIRAYNLPYSPLYDRTYTDKDDNVCHVKRNGCFGCATAMAFSDNQMAILRQIEPRIWEKVMKSGMAEQIIALKTARNKGQPGLTSYCTTEQIMEFYPCELDSLKA